MHTKIQSTWQLTNMELKTKSIRNWKKQLPELIKISDKSIKSSLHHGRKEETDEVENEIVDRMLINRSLGISVCSWEVIINACSQTIL